MKQNIFCEFREKSLSEKDVLIVKMMV